MTKPKPLAWQKLAINHQSIGKQICELRDQSVELGDKSGQFEAALEKAFDVLIDKPKAKPVAKPEQKAKAEKPKKEAK